MRFIKVDKRSTFNIHEPICIRLLTRLCLDFSQLNEHKFQKNFSDTASPMCNCGSEIDTTEYFLLRCLFFAVKRNYLFKSLLNINPHCSTLWIR